MTCPYPQYYEAGQDGRCLAPRCPALEDCPGDLNGEDSSNKQAQQDRFIALAADQVECARIAEDDYAAAGLAVMIALRGLADRSYGGPVEWRERIMCEVLAAELLKHSDAQTLVNTISRAVEEVKKLRL